MKKPWWSRLLGGINDENARWLWFFLVIGVASFSFIEIVFSLAHFFLRGP